MPAQIDPNITDPADVVTSPSPNPIDVIQRAHKLLGAASPDWQRRGPTDGSEPLHWPAAVAAARAHLEHAITLLAHT